MYRFFPLVYSPLKVRVDSCFSTMPKLQPRIVYSTINVKERQVPALWRELYENFSFLLLQNMVRADVFSGFFCGFEWCGSPIPSAFGGATGQAAAFLVELHNSARTFFEQEPD